MTWDHTQTAALAIPTEQFSYMTRKNQAPRRLQIFVGARRSGSLTRYDQQPILGLNPGADNDENGYGAMLGLGGFFAYAFSLPGAPGAGVLYPPETLFDPGDSLGYAMTRITPPNVRPFAFPASAPLSDTQMDQFFEGLTGRGSEQ
jgi:hypothetical protein